MVKWDLADADWEGRLWRRAVPSRVPTESVPESHFCSLHGRSWTFRNRAHRPGGRIVVWNQGFEAGFPDAARTSGGRKTCGRGGVRGRETRAQLEQGEL